MAEQVVLDASAMVELMIGSTVGISAQRRLHGCVWHAPAHFDAEVLSAMGRLQRAGRMTPRQVTSRLDLLADAPIQRHVLGPLLLEAWRRRDNLRLVDALYVALAERLDASLVSSDRGMASASARVELLGG